MLFPEGDESRALSRFPIVLVTIIAANVVMFLVELIMGDDFILRYSVKPAEIAHGEHLETLFTSMFLHADFFHIFGNMLYLWVFGDELEANYLGPIRFAVFYLVCGLAANFLQIAVDPTSTVPKLGASGAIAGVLGAFLIVFPRDRILVYVFPFWQARVTAVVFIGFWFIFQLVNGVGSITSVTQGGVAYFAHIGGFIAGAVLVRLFGAGLPRDEERDHPRLREAKQRDRREKMTRQQIPLGRIFGVSIGLDYSWFLIFVLLTWWLAVNYYPAHLPGRPPSNWILGAVSAIMLLVSVLLHDLGHSVVARHYRVPVRSITIFLFGGGSQIGGEAPSGRAEFWIALAGPAVSLVLAVVFYLLHYLLAGIGPLFALDKFAKYLAYMNGALALVSLIPGLPLDGGRVLRAILSTTTRNFGQATLIAATVGRAIAFLVILRGVWLIFAGYSSTGLWIAFVGWFLESAASAQVQRQILQGALAGHTVAEVMNRNYATIPATIHLQELVDRHILGGGRRCFIVTQGDQAVGLVTLHQIKEVPREGWPTMSVAQAMTPVARLKRVRLDTGLWAAVEEMDRDGVNQLPVMTDGQILGMLSRDDVISFLRTLQDLGVWPSARGPSASVSQR